jgi:hypothetical protein
MASDRLAQRTELLRELEQNWQTLEHDWQKLASKGRRGPQDTALSQNVPTSNHDAPVCAVRPKEAGRLQQIRLKRLGAETRHRRTGAATSLSNVV